jgi:hypothetical protein
VAPGIDVDQPIIIGGCEIADRGHVGNTGINDEQIDPSMAGPHAIHHASDIIGRCEVAGQGLASWPHRCTRGSEMVGCAADGYDVSARGDQLFNRREPDAAGSARDQSDLSGEGHDNVLRSQFEYNNECCLLIGVTPRNVNDCC